MPTGGPHRTLFLVLSAGVLCARKTAACSLAPQPWLGGITCGACCAALLAPLSSAVAPARAARRLVRHEAGLCCSRCQLLVSARWCGHAAYLDRIDSERQRAEQRVRVQLKRLDCCNASPPIGQRHDQRSTFQVALRSLKATGRSPSPASA